MPSENQDGMRSIQVKLSLISGEDTMAFKQMSEAFKTSAEFFKSFNAKEFFNTVTQAQGMVERLRAETTQMRTAGQSQPMAPVPPLAPPEPQAYQDQLGRWRDSRGRFTSPPSSVSPPIDTPPPGQTWDDPNALALGSAVGSSVASISQGTPANTAQQSQQDTSNNGQPSYMVGKLNALTMKLQRFSGGHMGGLGGMAAALGGASAGMSAANLPTSLGGSIGTLGSTALKTGVEGGLIGTMLTGAYSGMRNLEHVVSNPITTAANLFNPFNAAMTGAQLGYGRGGSVAGLFANPFSPASAEGFRQASDIFSLAMQPGINLGQAQQIEQASAQYGFSGQFGGSVTDQLLAPLFKQFGMNPQQVLTNFGAGLRTGVITVSQLRGELENLGQAAQTASMSLTDTSNAVASANQSVQSIGGTPQTGIAFGTQFQGLTGLPANVGGSLVTNPFIQSFIAMQTGVMPALQGTLGATNLTQGVLGGMQMLQNLYSKAFPTRTESITNPYGGGPAITQTQSSQSQANALIANLTGLDVGQVGRIEQYQKATQWGAYLTGLSNRFTGNVDAKTGSVPYSDLSSYVQKQLRARGTVADGATDVNTGHAQITDISGGKVTFKANNGYSYSLPVTEVLGQGHDMNYVRDLLAGQELSSKGIGGLSESTLDAQIKKSGLWQTGAHTTNEINKVNKLYSSNPQSALRRLKSDVSHQLQNAYQGTGSGGPTIQIAMTGQAAKLFKASPTTINLNLNANSGTGPTMNYAISQPQGANPLLGYTPYDEGS